MQHPGHRMEKQGRRHFPIANGGGRRLAPGGRHCCAAVPCRTSCRRCASLRRHHYVRGLSAVEPSTCRPAGREARRHCNHGWRSRRQAVAAAGVSRIRGARGGHVRPRGLRIGAAPCPRRWDERRRRRSRRRRRLLGVRARPPVCSI